MSSQLILQGSGSVSPSPDENLPTYKELLGGLILSSQTIDDLAEEVECRLEGQHDTLLKEISNEMLVSELTCRVSQVSLLLCRMQMMSEISIESFINTTMGLNGYDEG